VETVHTDRDPFTRLARELAERPDLIARLLADHPIDGGPCSGCCVPGGRIKVDAPCSIRALAQTAAAARAAALR
jgi:hypothetical protein